MEELKNLQWRRARVDMKNRSPVSPNNELPCVMLQQIVDDINHSTSEFKLQKVIFHGIDASIHTHFELYDAFSVEFLFFGGAETTVELWLKMFSLYCGELPKIMPEHILENKDYWKHLSVNDNTRLRLHYMRNTGYDKAFALNNEASAEERAVLEKAWAGSGLYNVCFTVESSRPVECRSLENLLREMPALSDECQELCLEFLFPFPNKFSRQRGRSPQMISEAEFIRTARKRLKLLFRREVLTDESVSLLNMQILPWYWKLIVKQHRFRNKSREPATIGGYTGNVYIRGDLKTVYPLLLILSEIHAGPGLSCSKGFFLLHAEPVSCFNDLYTKKEIYKNVLGRILEEDPSSRQLFAECRGFDVDEEVFIGSLIERLRAGLFVPQPHAGFRIPKKDGRDRIVESLNPVNKLIHGVLCKILNPVYEAVLSDCAIGYRKNLSRELVADRINEARKRGFLYVAESDIDNFFPSIDLAVLEKTLQSLLPAADKEFLALLMKSIRTGYTLDDKECVRIKGLAQGSPLSPMLSNLYLLGFDEAMNSESTALLRYGDDFIILTHSEQEAKRALEKAKTTLAELRLSIKESKTAIRRIDDGFQFLGIHLGTGEIADGFKKIPYRKTVYITEPYVFLAMSGDALEIRRDKQTIANIPLRRVSEIVILESTSFSIALAAKCRVMKVDIVIAFPSGYSVSVISARPRVCYDRICAHTARVSSLSESETILIAKDIVHYKIENYINVFKEKYAEGNGVVIKDLKKAQKNLQSVNTVEEIRGVEGASARKIFEGLNRIIRNQSFHIVVRDSERKDPINVLLNFSYYLLFTRLNALVRAAGLNPFMGFLHSPHNRYESLVCDLMEPFRSCVDKAVLRTINLGVIEENDFSPMNNTLHLKYEKRREFLRHYEREMETEGKNGRIKLKDAIKAQVNVVRRWADGNGDLNFYTWED